MEKDKQSWPWDEGDAGDISEFVREQELSPEDLAIIKAFEEMDDTAWQTQSQTEPVMTPSIPSHSEDTLDDMLLIFVDEVEEDITRIRRALNQLEQQDGTSIDSARLVTVKRAAHKIRGSAGMVECGNLSTIAHYLEEISERALGGHIEPFLALNALVQGAHALEVTLDGFVQEGHENALPRETFEQSLHDLRVLPGEEAGAFEESDQVTLARELRRDVTPIPTNKVSVAPLLGDLFAKEDASSPAMMRVEQRRFEQLQQHSERLMGQHMPLEQAQKQVESALQELQAAQMRLQQLEPRLISSLLPGRDEMPTREFLSSSSLIQRILQEKQVPESPETQGEHTASSPYSQRQFKRPGKLGLGTAHWDELNMERYSEKDMLLRSFREAVADVTVASTRVQSAIDRYNQVIGDCLHHAMNVRNDLRLLRLAPLSVILPRLRQALQWYSSEQVQFDVSGETLEIDQEVLATLTEPLVQLLHSCVRDALVESEEMSSGHEGEVYHVWLHASRAGGELELEIGFSTAVQGGALTLIYEPVQRLNGTITVERNARGGVSFHLRLPASRGSIHCLLVRCGEETVVVPFSQIQRIGESTSEQFDLKFNLNDMLNISATQHSSEAPHSAARMQTVLVLPRWGSHRVSGVMVDEVIGEAEFVIKPLPAYLRRPGLAGTAIDGRERILLVLDLPELISAYTSRQRGEEEEDGASIREQSPSHYQSQEPKILIADDSVSMRLSLRQTLSHAHYSVMEASDGLEALELLQKHVPDVLLLDIEMPNLNGYDLLNLMRLRPELATVKTIMLTSRSSEQHMKHAMELGVYGYLTKPCPLDVLLDKIQEALKSGARSGA